jgi:F-type H+-transporting ATPase subunit b
MAYNTRPMANGNDGEDRMTTRMTRTGRRAAMAAATGAFLLAGLALPLAARAASELPVEPEQPGLLDWDYATLLWVLGIFIVVALVLYKTAWPNVVAGLTAREQRIRRDIADAEAARTKAEASLVEYNKTLASAEGQVRELLARATTDAERIATSIRMRAQQDAEEAKEKAVKDIEASKEQALSEIYEQAANLATSVAEKILRRSINADDQKALVDESLRQMQSASV